MWWLFQIAHTILFSSSEEEQAASTTEKSYIKLGMRMEEDLMPWWLCAILCVLLTALMFSPFVIALFPP